MPSFRALSGKFFGNTVGIASGVAAGGATARALDPILQAVTNAAWEQNPDVPPNAYVMAEGVAQGQVTKTAAYQWAAEQGLGSKQMDALVNVANVGPGIASAYEAWRRGFLTDAEFNTALNRTGLETQWWDAMRKLKAVLLDPADIARGIHRGLIPDPGLLKGNASPGPGKVEAYPVYNIDALQEAAGHGVDHDRLGVLVGLQGLPMGSHEAAQALFRNVIEENDYLRAIAEGNTRNEWADAIKEQSREIPTSHAYVENAIRGYITLDQAKAGAARHGMEPDDVDVLYRNAGRPMTPHQITQALARGAKFNPIPGELTDPYDAAAHESNVHVSYQEMYAALRYNYPSLFQLNTLVKGNAISPDIAADWATKDGYAPEVVTTLHEFWTAQAAGGGGATGTKPKAFTYSQIHQAWRNGVFTDAQAVSELEAIGYSADRANTLLNTWKASPPPIIPSQG